MGVIQLNKINFDNLIPIKVGSFEGKLYHDNKYAYKILEEKVRLSSEKIISLLQKDNLKFLVDIIHLIKQGDEYIGYIMPYLKDYIHLLEATKCMPLNKRLTVIKTMGEFFNQFNDKPYVYGDIKSDNILVKPNARSNMLKFVDVDSITLLSNRLFLLPQDDLETYFEFDIFENEDCFNEDCFEGIDGYSKHDDILNVILEVALLSLTVITDYNWQKVFHDNDYSYGLELINKTYNDINLTRYFECLFCEKAKSKKIKYFGEDMDKFDIEKIYKINRNSKR